MTTKEMILLSKLLDLASDEFSNHGCNDVPNEWLDNWTSKEKMDLAKKCSTELYGAGEYYYDEDPCFNDSSLMRYFSLVLANIAGPSLKDSG